MQVKLPASKLVPLAEAAERLRLPADLLARRLASPSFFCASAVVRDGEQVVGITERGLSRLTACGIEQLYSLADAAGLLGLNVWTLYRARDAGKLEVVEVLGEQRVKESTLAGLLCAPSPSSFFARGRKGAVK